MRSRSIIVSVVQPVAQCLEKHVAVACFVKSGV
jgi:hypothetical protein